MTLALVPTTCAEIRCTRRVNSVAARRENVSRRISARIGTIDDQVRYPMRQSVGLARAGAGDHEQGPGTAFASNAMLYCLALRPIEFSWVASGDRHGRIGSWKMSPESMFSFCSQHFRSVEPSSCPSQLMGAGSDRNPTRMICSCHSRRADGDVASLEAGKQAGEQRCRAARPRGLIPAAVSAYMNRYNS